MGGHFHLVFKTVLSLTVLSGLCAGALAIFAQNPTGTLVERLFSAALDTFTLGVGAIFALLSAAVPGKKDP